MVVISGVGRLKSVIQKVRSNNLRIGFVPTMGALHPGHISLIKQARKECDFTVVSIFVNPVQFGPGEDFKKYPRPLASDKRMLSQSGVDLLFTPGVFQMYPADFSVFVEETVLSKGLCGQARPGHFRGVCTIVAKLFNIVTPDIAYFGQKDYQQACVIRRMARDLNFSLKIKILPTVRDKDGLALSSRNRYLSDKERKSAVALSRALFAGKRMVEGGQRVISKVLGAMRSVIGKEKAVRIDYLEIRRAGDMKKIGLIQGRMVLAAAIFIGKTRLIDNVLVNAKLKKQP